ncbi:MAG: hypothetical protein DHS20C12_02270 [Pseudohongiella sp.]|nr:MAG: hypothetical protein DHS20C12_02270 [Pseudohongiella sp.]
MISNLIVFSTLFLAALFTLLYLVRPDFRARIEMPKTTFLRQLSMYDDAIGFDRRDAESPIEDNDKLKPEVETK